MNGLSILYVKNADSSLAPLVQCLPGETRTVDVSLAHQNQKRARICFYLFPDSTASENLDRSRLVDGIPAGVLDIKNLPENLFDEVRIRMQVLMHNKRTVEVFTWLNNEPLKRGRFRIKGHVPEEKNPLAPRSARPRKGLAWPPIRYATLTVTAVSLAELVASLFLWISR